MNNFEIAILLVLIAYGIIFGIICAGLFSRTRRNNSAIKITNKMLDCHDIRIDGIVDRMDFLVQIIGNEFEELKKEDNTNACSMKKCPMNASTFESCDLSESECEYYTKKEVES